MTERNNITIVICQGLKMICFSHKSFFYCLRKQNIVYTDFKRSRLNGPNVEEPCAVPYPLKQ